MTTTPESSATQTEEEVLERVHNYRILFDGISTLADSLDASLYFREIDDAMQSLNSQLTAAKAENERLRLALEMAKEHSCDLEDADFGWFPCCNRRDYEGHGEECYICTALFPSTDAK